MAGRHVRKTKWMLAAGGVLTAAAATAAFVRYQYVAITVDGMSMSPALYPGDKVLIRRGTKGIRPGRIVVLSRPQSQTGWSDNPPAGRDLDATDWYIKRCVAVAGEPYPPELNREGVVPEGHLVVIGDHPRSEDSKQHGPVPIDQVLGVQVRKLSVKDPEAAARGRGPLPPEVYEMAEGLPEEPSADGGPPVVALSEQPLETPATEPIELPSERPIEEPEAEVVEEPPAKPARKPRKPRRKAADKASEAATEDTAPAKAKKKGASD